MVEAVFFYGTLMTGFERRRRAGIEPRLAYVGHGSIQGSLFDLGLYPAAVPSNEGRIRGEVYRMSRPERVLPILDEIEGYSPDDPGRSLYTRDAVAVTLDQGGTHQAWAYFYNAPLGKATRILSGDYLAHVHRT